MRYSKAIVHVLNELVKIHYDRIEGYSLSLKVLRQPDERIMNMFHDFNRESKECIQQLSEQICKEGGSVCNTSTIAGKIYRGWMRFKIATRSSDAQLVILNCCRFGEYAAQEAYETALCRSDEMSEDIIDLLMMHREKLKHSRISLKEYKKHASVVTL